MLKIVPLRKCLPVAQLNPVIQSVNHKQIHKEFYEEDCRLQKVAGGTERCRA